MALTFNGSTSLLEYVGSLGLAYPISIFAWVKSANNTQTAGIVSSSLAGAGDLHMLQITSSMNARTRSSAGANNTAALAGSIVAGTWKPTLCTYVLTSRNIFHGAATNSNAGTNDAQPANHTRFCVGERGYLGDLPYTGDVAEVAIWSGVQLLQADFDLLAAGDAPETVQPTFLVDAWSLLTQAATQTGVNGTVLTATDTSQAGDHPITRGSGQTVSPGAGRADVTGYAPVSTQPNTLSPGAGSVTATGYAPGVSQITGIRPGAGHVTVTGYAPILLHPATLAPAAGRAEVAGYAPTVSQALALAPGVGHVAATGYAPTVDQPAPDPSYEIRSNGIQTMSAQPLSAFKDGYTYAGWVTSGGTVGITKWNHAAGTGQDVTLAAGFQANNHASSTVHFLPDGRIATFYSRHNDATGLRYHITTSGTDIATFGTQQVMTASGAVAYNIPHYLSLPGKHYVHFRTAAVSTKCRASADLATWDTERTIISNGSERPYVVSRSNGVDRIDYFFSSGHPAEVATSMYHAYMTVDAGGTESWFKSDGTGITAPATPANATLVYDGTTVSGWNPDIQMDRQGHPRVVFQRFVTPGTDHRHVFSRWTGSAWTTVTEICPAGGQLQSGEIWSDGQACLDAHDPRVCYATVTTLGKKRLQKWVTEDDGATWSYVGDLNTTTVHDAFTPSSPANHDGRAACVFNFGTAVDYTNYTSTLRAVAGLQNVTPTAGSVTATGYAPTLALPRTISPSAGSVTASGYAPTLTQGAGQFIAPTAGRADVTGYAPTLLQPATVAPGAGSVTATGYAPGISQLAAIKPPAGHVTITGYAPALTLPRAVAPTAGRADVTGYAPTVSQAVTLAPAAGRAEATGYAPTVTRLDGQILAPGAGRADLSGHAPIIVQGATLSPTTGRIEITGYGPSITQASGPTVSPTAGSAEYHGYAPSLRRTWTRTLPLGSRRALPLR